MLWAQAEIVDALKDNWVLIAIGLGVLFAAYVLFKIATGRKKPPPDLEKGLRENLAEYPPPPPGGPRRLTVDGIPVRLRLVVIAPTGPAHEPIAYEEVPDLLDEVVRGLGGLTNSDKPRVKIWPKQLSATGFAPTFHRLVASPDAGQKLSRWVKVAGPARSGQRPVLLGLALLADEPCKLGEIQVEPLEWRRLLQVER